MKVKVEMKDVAGYLATIEGMEYKTISDLYDSMDSDKVIILRFPNRDIILNMKNIVNIVVYKDEKQ